jgi:hypothetical protein
MKRWRVLITSGGGDGSGVLILDVQMAHSDGVVGSSSVYGESTLGARYLHLRRVDGARRRLSRSELCVQRVDSGREVSPDVMRASVFLQQRAH